MLGQIIQVPAILEDITFELDGETVHRITAEYCGHVICLLQYDMSPFLVVGIDDDFQQVHIDQAESYIERETGG